MSEQYLVCRNQFGKQVVVPVSVHEDGTIDAASPYVRLGLALYPTREGAEAAIAAAEQQTRAASAATRPDPAAGIGRSGRQDAKRFWRD